MTYAGRSPGWLAEIYITYRVNANRGTEKVGESRRQTGWQDVVLYLVVNSVVKVVGVFISVSPDGTEPFPEFFGTLGDFLFGLGGQQPGEDCSDIFHDADGIDDACE
ncbi:hypothetical protein RRF57_011667 [Xylaria bambusicola]|uniref:Uncharacterized protein n=1 Tax=Xylaria bambusicola TaxID=326684 RepID=A0AAN7UN79_9PEZI